MIPFNISYKSPNPSLDREEPFDIQHSCYGIYQVAILLVLHIKFHRENGEMPFIIDAVCVQSTFGS